MSFSIVSRPKNPAAWAKQRAIGELPGGLVPPGKFSQRRPERNSEEEGVLFNILTFWISRLGSMASNRH
jgi:hypothetical protein